jgi:hypothetical protein
MTFRNWITILGPDEKKKKTILTHFFSIFEPKGFSIPLSNNKGNEKIKIK